MFPWKKLVLFLSDDTPNNSVANGAIQFELQRYGRRWLLGHWYGNDLCTHTLHLSLALSQNIIKLNKAVQTSCFNWTSPLLYGLLRVHILTYYIVSPLDCRQEEPTFAPDTKGSVLHSSNTGLNQATYVVKRPRRAQPQSLREPTQLPRSLRTEKTPVGQWTPTTNSLCMAVYLCFLTIVCYL